MRGGGGGGEGVGLGRRAIVLNAPLPLGSTSNHRIMKIMVIEAYFTVKELCQLIVSSSRMFYEPLLVYSHCLIFVSIDC